MGYTQKLSNQMLRALEHFTSTRYLGDAKINPRTVTALCESGCLLQTSETDREGYVLTGRGERALGRGRLSLYDHERRPDRFGHFGSFRFGDLSSKKRVYFDGGYLVGVGPPEAVPFVEIHHDPEQGRPRFTVKELRAMLMWAEKNCVTIGGRHTVNQAEAMQVLTDRISRFSNSDLQYHEDPVATLQTLGDIMWIAFEWARGDKEAKDWSLYHLIREVGRRFKDYGDQQKKHDREVKALRREIKVLAERLRDSEW